MSAVQGKEIPIEVLGGLVTNIDPQALPPGVSSDCADVAFKPGVPGTVKTRPGMVFKTTFGLDSNYMGTYIDNRGNNHNLYLNADGSLWDEFPQGTFTKVSADQQSSNGYAKSDTAFGSEFMAFSDGKFGKDIPRRYTALGEGNTYDRLSQVGPGLAPVVSDYNSSVGIVADPAGLLNLQTPYNNVPSQAFGPSIDYLPSNGFISFQTTTPGSLAGLEVGDMVTIAGATDAFFNGTFPVLQIFTGGVDPDEVLLTFAGGPTPHTDGSGTGVLITNLVEVVTSSALNAFVGGTLTIVGATDPAYDGTFPVRIITDPTHAWVYIAAIASEASSGGGAVSVSGNIPAGVHQISVLFITRNGYFTAPAPPRSWTAAGMFSALVSQIPLGPPNVIARLLIATAAGGANFFFAQAASLGITSFLVPNNTDTTAVIDFTDLALNSATSADLLFDRIELPEVAGLLQFADRIMAWGARNRVENFVNLSFDGGVLAPGGYPLGWSSVAPLLGATGISDQFGFDYIISQPVVPISVGGMITQSAFQDYLGVAILSPLTDYSLRVRLKRDTAQSPDGAFTVDIYSPGTATVLATASVSLAAVPFSQFEEFIVAFDTEMPAEIPSDAILRLYMSWGVVGGANRLHVENVQLFPTDEPYQTFVMYASNAADPEAFQGVTGFLNVNENDGRALRAAFIIRDRFYMLKTIGGLYVTSDDPSNEPSGWTIDTISRRVGAVSINSVGTKTGDVGEDWVFIASREGMYIFWSNEPPKISQEIQPTWEAINWDFAHTMWVQVDTANRRLLIGVPTGSNIKPNQILHMDYQSVGDTAEEIAAASPVRPTYAGQEKAHAAARKWAPWNIPASSAAFLERDDGQSHLTVGINSISALLAGIYEISESELMDATLPIPGGGYYVTAFYPDDEQRQGLQIQGDRVLQRYMTLQVNGIGNFEIQAFGPGFVNSEIRPGFGAPALALENPSAQDMETYFNFSAERIANKFTASDPDSPWWSLQNMSMWIDQDPVLVMRGYN